MNLVRGDPLTSRSTKIRPPQLYSGILPSVKPTLDSLQPYPPRSSKGRRDSRVRRHGAPATLVPIPHKHVASFEPRPFKKQGTPPPPSFPTSHLPAHQPRTQPIHSHHHVMHHHSTHRTIQPQPTAPPPGQPKFQRKSRHIYTTQHPQSIQFPTKHFGTKRPHMIGSSGNPQPQPHVPVPPSSKPSKGSYIRRRSEKPKDAAQSAKPVQPINSKPPSSSGSTVPSPSQTVTKPPSKPSTPSTKQQPPSPVTPAYVLQHHSKDLTEFELSEILQYPHVWYWGQGAKKTRASPALPHNHGHDTEKGEYKIVLHDHIAYRYEIIGTCGSGSFGQVVKVYDYKQKRTCALKLILNQRRFHMQGLVEVKILEHIRKHDPDCATNTVRTFSSFFFRSHLVVTFELLSYNLYEFLVANDFAGLSLSLIRKFAIQLLNSLRFLRQHRIIHADLKLENVLLKDPRKSGIKVIDFGSSCFEDKRVYSYIQSRFYRAPEVILGLPYGMPIDMWSFGCILAELYTGYPIFPGEDESEQLGCIMEIIGVPPLGLIRDAPRRKVFFDSHNQPKPVINSRGKRRRPGTKNIGKAMNCTDSDFISFLSGCLHWDPKKRMTPDEALQHSWIDLVGFKKQLEKRSSEKKDK
ncbi:Dual specificity tyrosine-phosphorylation-regulated kinase 4 [Aduncisulcus paluster]|uniref:dual-specificity kinase n=1 Tax=Aduncisulcus paluster TaxID=2918883 RepID=A0ABQ5K056_9EUKA|nr:Dual specificity tyrosine-phosphorylation-regulated kinase 4 [Aduncisulcus paluster]